MNDAMAIVIFAGIGGLLVIVIYLLTAILREVQRLRCEGSGPQK